jgi:hypothetical protein
VSAVGVSLENYCWHQMMGNIVFGIALFVAVLCCWFWVETMDRCKSSKRWHLLINPLWMFSPSLFDEEGNVYRRRLIASLAVLLAVVFFWWLIGN